MEPDQLTRLAEHIGKTYLKPHRQTDFSIIEHLNHQDPFTRTRYRDLAERAERRPSNQWMNKLNPENIYLLCTISDLDILPQEKSQEIWLMSKASPLEAVRAASYRTLFQKSPKQTREAYSYLKAQWKDPQSSPELNAQLFNDLLNYSQSHDKELHKQLLESGKTHLLQENLLDSEKEIFHSTLLRNNAHTAYLEEAKNLRDTSSDITLKCVLAGRDDAERKDFEIAYKALSRIPDLDAHGLPLLGDLQQSLHGKQETHDLARHLRETAYSRQPSGTHAPAWASFVLENASSPSLTIEPDAVSAIHPHLDQTMPFDQKRSIFLRKKDDAYTINQIDVAKGQLVSKTVPRFVDPLQALRNPLHQACEEASNDPKRAAKVRDNDFERAFQLASSSDIPTSAKGQIHLAIVKNHETTDLVIERGEYPEASFLPPSPYVLLRKKNDHQFTYLPFDQQGKLILSAESAPRDLGNDALSRAIAQRSHEIAQRRQRHISLARTYRDDPSNDLLTRIQVGIMLARQKYPQEKAIELEQTTLRQSAKHLTDSTGAAFDPNSTRRTILREHEGAYTLFQGEQAFSVKPSAQSNDKNLLAACKKLLPGNADDLHALGEFANPKLPDNTIQEAFARFMALEAGHHARKELSSHSQAQQPPIAR